MKNNENSTKLCKYCRTEIPKDAKICPHCRKKQSHTLRWVVIGIVAFFVIVTAIGHEEKNNSSSGAGGKTEHVNNKSASKSVSDSDFEKMGYLYNSGIGTTSYYVVIKNNSDAIVSIHGNAVAKDAAGNSVGADDMDIDVLGPGETTAEYFWFGDVGDVATVECSYTYNTNPYYKNVLSNLDVKNTLNEENVVTTITNNGDYSASFVDAYALFFNENNEVISAAEAYIMDDEDEIKPGATLSGQLDCYKSYDHVEVYLKGRAEK